MLTALAAENLSWARLQGGRFVFGETPWEAEGESAVALSADGRWAAVAGRDHYLHLWTNCNRVAELRLELPGMELAFSRDGKRLGVGTAAGIALYAIPKLELLARWEIPSPVRCLGVSGDSVAGGLADGRLFVGNGCGQNLFKRSERPLSGLTWLGKKVVVGGKDGSVWFDEKQLLQSGPQQVHALSCWEKASLIAIATEVVSVLKAETGELVASWPVEAEALEFSSDGTLVALLRGRMEPTRLNLVSGPRSCLGISSSQGPGVMSFSPDSTQIAATHFRCIELWQLEPWKRLARREMPEGMTRMEFVNGDLHLLMEDPPSLLTLRLPELEIVSARKLPFRSVDMVLAGQLALAPEEESIQLHLWDCRSLPPRKLCSLDQYRTVAMESSADGRYLAAVTYQAGTDSPIDLYVWDLHESYSPRHLGEFRYLYGPVFTAQGLVALADGQLRTWEVSTWSTQTELCIRPDTPVIGGLVALDDGRLLRGNHFLDPSRKTTELCLDLGEDILDVAASPDGRWIAVKPRQGAVYVVETPRRPPWA